MTRYSIRARPLPAPVRALPHLLRATAVFCTVLWLQGCVGPEGMVDAAAVKPAVDLVTERHDAMIRGDLDPSTLGGQSPEEVEALRRAALRTSDLLRSVIDTAAGEGKDG